MRFSIQHGKRDGTVESVPKFPKSIPNFLVSILIATSAWIIGLKYNFLVESSVMFILCAIHTSIRNFTVFFFQVNHGRRGKGKVATKWTEKIDCEQNRIL